MESGRAESPRPGPWEMLQGSTYHFGPVPWHNGTYYRPVHASLIIIIILYFENVAFFHAKLGLDVCPRIDNQTSGDALQDLTQPLVDH